MKKVHRCFTPWTHQHALRDPQISLDAKTQFWRNVYQHAFL
jgi:hypothetical protein